MTSPSQLFFLPPTIKFQTHSMFIIQNEIRSPRIYYYLLQCLANFLAFLHLVWDINVSFAVLLNFNKKDIMLLQRIKSRAKSAATSTIEFLKGRLGSSIAASLLNDALSSMKLNTSIHFLPVSVLGLIFTHFYSVEELVKQRVH